MNLDENIIMKDLYEFDYNKAQPNRFAEKFDDDALVIVLDPDVAAIFQTQEEVNNVLRALIATMPTVEASAKNTKAA